ncbi:MAG: methylenetetrahydrofolate reductase [Deltaproteobacteria bacterium]|nr:methylenetetrahydrofolate reductase [Deltaproteobacteria bacterium]
MTVEVVPPEGPDAGIILDALSSLSDLPIDGFSVATNPVAKPRMSAMAMCSLIQETVSKPATLHCTTRDHNRLSLQGKLWGARALGIETILVATGDFVALGDRGTTTTVRDMDVYGLVKMARAVGMKTGVVFDTHPEMHGLKQAVRHLERKTEAGAQFAVTQPVYDEAGVDLLAESVRHIDIPIIMGILPLRTPRHAMFLHERVGGIIVPGALRDRMHRATDPVAEGAFNAKKMIGLARARFSGVCVMPPFDHYEVLADIL